MKRMTIILSAAPYCSQDVDTALGLVEAALKRGHQVSLVGSGDGTYGFLKGQKASAAPNAEQRFAGLTERGLKVDL